MANAHMAEARNMNVPLDSSKFLFSVDLVHCVISTRWPNFGSSLREVDGTYAYRDQVYNAFVGEVKDAVVYLADKHYEDVQRRFEEYVQNNNKVTVDSFKTFQKEFKSLYFITENDYNTRNLLKYFVSIALLAGHYHQHGLTSVPEIAANFVLLELPSEQFLDSTYWDLLAQISKQILGTEEEPVVEPRNLNLIEYQEH